MRLFYAIELTDDARAWYAETQTRLIAALSGVKVRWTQPRGAHITVLFLGDHENARLPIIEAAGTVAVDGVAPFMLSLHGLGRFPSHGPARVLWIGGTEPVDRPATRLAGRLRENLSDFDLDPKPFRLHVTLGYVDARAMNPAIDAAIGRIIDRDSVALPVERLVLMQTISGSRPAVETTSEARPEIRNSRESRYTIVQTFPFQMPQRSPAQPAG